MPLVTRSRALGAAPQRLWTVIADPAWLPQWWPNVQRVEDVSRDAWTLVLEGTSGKALRADYTLISSDHPHRLRWRHELEETPFERIMSSSTTEVELEPTDTDATLVRLSTDIKLRGFARFGGFQVRRATRRQLDGALDGLEALAAEWSGG